MTSTKGLMYRKAALVGTQQLFTKRLAEFGKVLWTLGKVCYKFRVSILVMARLCHGAIQTVVVIIIITDTENNIGMVWCLYRRIQNGRTAQLTKFEWPRWKHICVNKKLSLVTSKENCIPSSDSSLDRTTESMSVATLPQPPDGKAGCVE